MRRWLGMGACLLACLVSCKAWDRKMVPMPDLETGPLRSTQFPDVPVPGGMTLLLDRGLSASFEAGAYRWADLRYEGGTPLGTAAAFLRHQLPGFGWRITEDQSLRSGEVVLEAARNSDTGSVETVRYRLRQGDRSLRMRILLNVPAEAAAEAGKVPDKTQP